MEKLYHYTSFDTFLRIWASKRLKFGSVKNVNDIEEGRCDCRLTTVDNSRIPLFFAFQDVRLSFKQISLTMDYSDKVKGCMSPLMWAHYGDKRKGVCIELDYHKIRFPRHCFRGKIKYKKEIQKSLTLPNHIQSSKDIREYIKETRNDIFFTKLKCWEAENEYRIISDRYEYLNINGAITAIYLTSCKSEECIMTENLVMNEGIEVKYIHSHLGSRLFNLCESSTSVYREYYKQNDAGKLYMRAREFYNKHKYDENASLIWTDWNKNKL